MQQQLLDNNNARKMDMGDWEEDFYDDEDHYGAGCSSSSSGLKTHMVIPQNVMEAEFDLESDERRSLENVRYYSERIIRIRISR